MLTDSRPKHLGAGSIDRMDSFPDLNALTDQQLQDLIQELREELKISLGRQPPAREDRGAQVSRAAVSYTQRVLHGKIDIARAELVNRLRKKGQGGEDVGGAGVREPRRPTPQPGASGISLPAPGAADDNPAEPPPRLSDR
jgi:hypothetical protein